MESLYETRFTNINTRGYSKCHYFDLHSESLDKITSKIKQCYTDEREVSKSYFYVNNLSELFCIFCLMQRNDEVSSLCHVRLLRTKLMFLESMWSTVWKVSETEKNNKIETSRSSREEKERNSQRSKRKVSFEGRCTVGFVNYSFRWDKSEKGGSEEMFMGEK